MNHTRMAPLEILQRLINCTIAEVGGRSHDVQVRRRLLISYWYAYCHHTYNSTATPEEEDDWHTHVSLLFQAYTEAYHRFELGEGVTGADHTVEWELAGGVWQTVLEVAEEIREYDPANFARANACILKALDVLYNWKDNLRIRTYIYVLTGQILSNASIKTEKKLVTAALDCCRDRLAREIKALLEEGN